MKNYTYQNSLVGKKQLKQILSWSFTKYGSIQACLLADKLKNLGFKYATQAGISISIEDLRVPDVKNTMLENSTQEILNTEKICLKGKITDVERFQKVIDTWNITSELLKDEVVSYFKKYDPLNSVYIMAFSGARGNLSQVRQLVGMRGLMSDPSGEIMNLPIKKNFREGLTITDYLMSGYGARKGIVDTALKTANSGYLTRRLIDVAQDIIIREKDCGTAHSFLFIGTKKNKSVISDFSERIVGRLLNKPVYDPKTNELIAEINTQITPNLIRIFKQKKVTELFIRSPLTCSLYRSICQKCYGWDLASENLVDMGEAIGIIAGQSIGEPGTQLTMRTFHTGGIFTSEANQQLVSSIDGTIEFSNVLKTSSLRTNRGENVLLVESSGSLIIVSNEHKDNNVQLELPRNTILFIKNNQKIKKNTILGQLSGNIKQTRTETKFVLSDSSGEIFMPQLKTKTTLTTQNKLLWILAGEVYQAPIHSFLNFYPDYKINKHSYIFRSKIINQYSGIINFISNTENIFEQFIEIRNHIYTLENAKLQKLTNVLLNKDYLLSINDNNYLIQLQNESSKLTFTNIERQNFATLITNRFNSVVGGIPYYNKKFIEKKREYLNPFVYFLTNIQVRPYKTLIWLKEETHLLNCDKSLLLVEPDSFISENFEIVPNLFSKTSGILQVLEKNNIIHEISIKPGTVYTGTDLKKLSNQVFYPGELILNTIEIHQPSLCEIIKIGTYTQLLIRPIEIYEVPLQNQLNNNLFNDRILENAALTIKNNINYLYDSSQKIKSANSLSLIANTLNLHLKNSSRTQEKFEIEIVNNNKKNLLQFLLVERIQFINFLPPHLKYTHVQSCLLVQANQFVSSHSLLGYLEVVSPKSLQLVKFKSKQKQNKQIFVISNDNCTTIGKEKVQSKSVNDLLIDEVNIEQTGKILIDNGNTLTIQKGRPYFFPNCKNEDFVNEIDLNYRFVPSQNSINELYHLEKNNVNLNYFNITTTLPHYLLFSDLCEKVQFPKMILKKRGKYYSSGIPIFVREFLIQQKSLQATKLSNLAFRPWQGYLDFKDKIYKTKKRDIISSLERIRMENTFVLFMKSSELVQNPIKQINNRDNRLEFASVALLEHPFRVIGIHSITEDYFEQEVNSVFCKNGEFLEEGQTIGLLNFEKEITGDIVQGLPRIEELLEARKRKRLSKHTPKNQKKGLLIRKTTIDPTFEFRKIGTIIKDNEKINPHSLLKIYFNYYAKVKSITCTNNDKVFLYRLANNYQSSYRSFKKIQSLILNSVQAVYQSQGVTIADKHLEIIIKQMTTKVLITHEGETPLLPREVIDLYHIKYINQVVGAQNKKGACYVPLLLGITKAALNNPSFISAASFQETTRVLTKAAIEGRLDWLRGLKENIIIGHLIPAGIGSKIYVNSFEKQTFRQTETKYKRRVLKSL
uniref:DNA-directed RNA polymerase subunit beta'' n=1 Tax=Sundstroemia setigera TaxID=3005 RepID=A0A2U9NMT8_9STRA|nr:RNA polymerase beta' subunit [Rhizosolenia setigera]AWT38418.1 RNA polymerase beta' subunit [Rhizosolenia setigera]